jgi:hypothetical protein
MVFNATFNNISAISWRSVSLLGETGVPWENNRRATSHWQTSSHNVVSSGQIFSCHHFISLCFEILTWYLVFEITILDKYDKHKRSIWNKFCYYLCNHCLSPLTSCASEVHSIQHYVMKFVSDLWHVGCCEIKWWQLNIWPKLKVQGA